MTTISVSGLSSGADMAAQLLVAHSSLFIGGAIFAGQAWHCAIQRFPEDALLPLAASPSVPVCDGCPENKTLTYDHCKKAPIDQAVARNVSLLLAKAKAEAAASTIDPLERLSSQRIFLYRGLEDKTYNKGAVRGTAEFFSHFTPSVQFVTHVHSGHLLPAIEPYLCFWQEWSGPDNCTYDGAGAALRWVHGEAALAGGRDNDTEALSRALRPFDQRRFFPAGADPLLDDDGLVYVPSQCEGRTGCAVHMFLHGCGVDEAWYNRTNFEVYAEFSGLNNCAPSLLIRPSPFTRTLTRLPHRLGRGRPEPVDRGLSEDVDARRVHAAAVRMLGRVRADWPCVRSQGGPSDADARTDRSALR